MEKLNNLIGQTFGYWKVIGRAENHKSARSAQWLCQCECGNKRVVRGSQLTGGHSKSCGCHKNDYNKVHGGKGTRLYECWRQMRYRCQNQNNQAFKDYGSRGISVCEEWNDFSKFRDWALKNGYTENLTIDRINVNGNYEPSNCRWADSNTQMNKRRNTRKYAYGGKDMTISEWSRELNVPRTTINNRLKKGMSFDEAIGQ